MPNSKKKPTRSKAEGIGRGRIVSAGDGNVRIGAGFKDSVGITGFNRTDASYKFSSIFSMIEERSNLSTTDKSDLKNELKTFEDEDKKGPESNEGFLAQRLRIIRRIAPDILEAAMGTITNPAVGFGTIAKKVAEKMKNETK